MKYSLAENLRRIGVKNLAEAATTTKSAMAAATGNTLVGRTVTIWPTAAQTGVRTDIGIVDIKRTNQDTVVVAAIDLSDAAKITAYNAGEPVRVSIQLQLKRGDNKFMQYYQPDVKRPGFVTTDYYNKWLVGELNKLYFS